MTIHSTDDTLRSDRTPEFAQRIGPDTWRLSWLPEFTVTREQAWAGMELDELVSDLAAAHDRLAHAEISARADVLGIIWQQALIKLAKRVDERSRAAGDSVHDPPAPAHFPSRLRPTRLLGSDDRAPRAYYG
ncbi:hypothetical protein ATM97_32225 [Nocardia sp. MH4]|uniref:hypothetical protein n=1 Tax=Nocardia TaxID=1817 RepID=UPI001C4E5B32|nr:MULTISPECIES: hypothetical protein [Nocardia]MBW0273984.1 hypothetical protein [Nocardia sp. MH4]